MARQFETLSGVSEPDSVDMQYRQIAIDEIADIEVAAVRAERDGFGERADIDLADIGDLFAVDLESGDGSRRVIKERGFGHVRATRLDPLAPRRAPHR